MRAWLEQIVEGVRKCANLMSAFTTVARKEKPNPSTIQFAEFLPQVVGIVTYDFCVAGIEIAATAGDDLPLIVLDLPQVEMALLHLLANAHEAAAGSENPRVTVAATPYGAGVEVAVWDSGPALPEDRAVRAFEPFFTTKEPPHLGLGLTIARDTALQHGGELVYDSERGFLLQLPQSLDPKVAPPQA
jgi:C4-dicarboxylate-specific signal transduction histidine kinase